MDEVCVCACVCVCVHTFTVNRALARKEINSEFCINWEVKCSLGYGRIVSPSMGSVGDKWAKPFRNLQYLA